MVKWIEILALLTLGASASCAEPSEKVTEMTIEVENGLSFGVPDGYVFEASENAILIKPEKLLRTPDRVMIITGPPEPLPDGEVSSGQDPAPYTLVKREGGMGGPEYTLSIPKRVGDREVTVRAYFQSEYDQPVFPEAWAVWESLAADN